MILIVVVVVVVDNDYLQNHVDENVQNFD